MSCMSAPQPPGLIQAGYFYKDLSDPIVTLQR
jgi:hypothetical protein